MKLELPHSLRPLTDEERQSVEESIQLLSTSIYFKRLYTASPSTIEYFGERLISTLKDTDIRTVIADYRDNDPPTQQLRRLIVQKLKPMLSEINTIIFILDSDRKGFQRVMLEFFVKAYLQVKSTQVYFCETYEEAVQISETLSET